MTQSQLNIKITWGVFTIVASVLTTSFMLGKRVSDESNKIYNSVEAVRTENRLQDKDMELIKDRVQTNKLEIDIVRSRVDKLETR